MVTQKRLATVNGRGFTVAFAAILALVIALLAVAWISMASSTRTTQTQAAPSSAPAYQGHPLRLRPS